MQWLLLWYHSCLYISKQLEASISAAYRRLSQKKALKSHLLAYWFCSSIAKHFTHQYTLAVPSARFTWPCVDFIDVAPNALWHSSEIHRYWPASPTISRQWASPWCFTERRHTRRYFSYVKFTARKRLCISFKYCRRKYYRLSTAINSPRGASIIGKLPSVYIHITRVALSPPLTSSLSVPPAARCFTSGLASAAISADTDFATVGAATPEVRDDRYDGMPSGSRAMPTSASTIARANAISTRFRHFTQNMSLYLFWYRVTIHTARGAVVIVTSNARGWMGHRVYLLFYHSRFDLFISA